MQSEQNFPTNSSAPFVTFIITYYDLPVQMLCQCIDSILALKLQSEEREIIVVDDGSKVSPVNALMQYGDQIVYVRQTNGGLSVARNRGIELAHGEYLQFVDADDWLVRAGYDHSLAIVRRQPTIDILMFDKTDDPTLTNQPYNDKAVAVLSGTELMRGHNIHGTAWGYMFRRQVLGQLRFTPGIFHEDEEFTPLLLLRTEQVAVTEAKAYYYRLRHHSITNSDTDDARRQRLSDCHGVIVRLHQLCSSLPVSDSQALSRRVAQLTMDYIYQMIIQGTKRQEVEQLIAELYDEGLFPLPDRNYTVKYNWFRRMSATKAGRTLLIHLLPLLKKER